MQFKLEMFGEFLFITEEDPSNTGVDKTVLVARTVALDRNQEWGSTR
jgi:hypothetical protein